MYAAVKISCAKKDWWDSFEESANRKLPDKKFFVKWKY